MTMIKLVPTLMVKDVHRTIDFYQMVLGFELEQVIPAAAPFEWASMKCGDVEVAFQEESNMIWDIPEMQGMEIGGAFALCVKMEGVDALYERVKDKVVISQELFTFYPGLREFRIRDSDGYFWVFREKIPSPAE